MSRNYKNKLLYGEGWYGKKGKRIVIVKILRYIQNGNCKICNLPMFGKDTVDHIIPLSEGGKHHIENMQLLCQPCHSSKDRENNIKHGIIGSRKMSRFIPYCE